MPRHHVRVHRLSPPHAGRHNHRRTRLQRPASQKLQGQSCAVPSRSRAIATANAPLPVSRFCFCTTDTYHPLPPNQGPETFEALLAEYLPHVALALEAATTASDTESETESDYDSDAASDAKGAQAVSDDAAHTTPEAAHGAETADAGADMAITVSDTEGVQDVQTLADGAGGLSEEETAHLAWARSIRTLQLPRYRVASPPPNEEDYPDDGLDDFYECPCTLRCLMKATTSVDRAEMSRC